jgi:hypothetical protein
VRIDVVRELEKDAPDDDVSGLRQSQRPGMLGAVFRGLDDVDSLNYRSARVHDRRAEDVFGITRPRAAEQPTYGLEPGKSEQAQGADGS